MKTETKRIKLYSGKVTDILRSNSGVAVEIECGSYDKTAKAYATEKLQKRLDNPAQAENLEIGTKVAIFTAANGKTDLVRDGEWLASESIMVPSKKNPDKSYDNGVTVVNGRCVHAALVQPKEGQTWKPFFALTVMTDDHTMHRFSITNREPYEADAIEKAQERFKDYLKNDKHEFIPFTGTFVGDIAWKSEEKQHTVGDKTFTNTERSYNGLLTLGSYQDFEKAPERTRAAAEQEQSYAEEAPDFNNEIEEENPFDFA